MILSTTDSISGKELETLGLVEGSTVQARNVAKDFGQSLKSMVGGELKSYNEMMEQSHTLARERMIDEAKKLGADAVVGIRYESTYVLEGGIEVTAYGTAARVK